jgi:hypothetical protein
MTRIHADNLNKLSSRSSRLSLGGITPYSRQFSNLDSSERAIVFASTPFADALLLLPLK